MIDSEFLTIKEFAERLKISRKMVYEWVDSGRIRAIRITDKPKSPYRIPVTEIRRLHAQAYEVNND